MRMEGGMLTRRQRLHCAIVVLAVTVIVVTVAVTSAYGDFGKAVCRMIALAGHEKCLEQCGRGFWAMLPIIRDGIVDSCEKGCDEGTDEELRRCGIERDPVSAAEP